MFIIRLMAARLGGSAFEWAALWIVTDVHIKLRHFIYDRGHFYVVQYLGPFPTYGRASSSIDFDLIWSAIGKEMVDYIADYLENIRQMRVTPEVEPGFLSDHLPTEAPYRGENWNDIFRDFEDKIMPGVRLCFVMNRSWGR